MTKYTYKDFVTNKMHFTRGKFVFWTRGGILNAWGTVFQNQCTMLFVPEYLLTKETRAQLPENLKEKLS